MSRWWGRGPYFVTTSRGARILCIGGFKFRRHRDAGPKTRWYCSTHHGRGCSAALFTIDDRIIKCNNVHTHARI
ncbi:unnamed protein product, partial [Iphiclides podalirius]